MHASWLENGDAPRVSPVYPLIKPPLGRAVHAAAIVEAISARVVTHAAVGIEGNGAKLVVDASAGYGGVQGHHGVADGDRAILVEDTPAIPKGRILRQRAVDEGELRRRIVDVDAGASERMVAPYLNLLQRCRRSRHQDTPAKSIRSNIAVRHGQVAHFNQGSINDLHDGRRPGRRASIQDRAASTLPSTGQGQALVNVGHRGIPCSAIRARPNDNRGASPGRVNRRLHGGERTATCTHLARDAGAVEAAFRLSAARGVAGPAVVRVGVEIGATPG